MSTLSPQETQDEMPNTSMCVAMEMVTTFPSIYQYACPFHATLRDSKVATTGPCSEFALPLFSHHPVHLTSPHGQV